MFFIRNQIFMWHKCVLNSTSLTNHFRGTTHQCLALAKHLHQSSNTTWQSITFCSKAVDSCLKAKTQFRHCFVTFDRAFCSSSRHAMASSPFTKGTGSQEGEKLFSEMNIRLVNENNFLSWCRNTYLSSVVGVAMIAEGTTTLAQSAGVAALAVGTMNLLWGTACHISNLIRLRNISGMSGYTLTLNLLGSLFHCLLWLFALVCYIGFLDETNAGDRFHKANDGLEFQRLDTKYDMKDNEV